MSKELIIYYSIIFGGVIISALVAISVGYLLTKFLENKNK